jgi:hypothetical protein
MAWFETFGFSMLREQRYSSDHRLQLFTIICDSLTRLAWRVFIVPLGYKLSEPGGDS